MKSGVKALIFDVDGTLSETEEVHRLAFNRAFEMSGLDWDWDQELYSKLLVVPGGQSRLEYYLDTFDPADVGGLKARLPEVHRIKSHVYAKMIDQRLARLRPGVERLIDEAHSRGIQVVLATTSSIDNAEALIISNLELSGLEKISFIAGGDEVKTKKPSPEIYEMVLKRLKIPARNCLVFEDSENGLKAAMAAGLRTIVTPSTYSRGGDFSGAFAVLSSLGDAFDPYEHFSGAGDGETMVTVSALRRWVADDDDIRSLLTIGGKSLF
ncbi:HAD-IA family hydrolase [Oryzibacter oryziterrae]|uniref:HAD-IA family hydrolase n=1 Tax=Oryzibacter oryziterrae TaxID=2766474 RepID=UPI001EFFEE1C|nr:HAD-IA family hydrolase [Oryzibacter oryziterrae]